MLLSLQDHFFELWTICSNMLSCFLNQFYDRINKYFWFLQEEWLCLSFDLLRWIVLKNYNNYCLFWFKIIRDHPHFKVLNLYYFNLTNLNSKFRKNNNILFINMENLFFFLLFSISFHLFSNNLWFAAAQISILSSTFGFKQSLINCLLSFETFAFWLLGKFTVVAFNMIP